MPLEQIVLIARVIPMQRFENVSRLVVVFGLIELVKIRLEKPNKTESEKAIQFYFNKCSLNSLFSNFF